MTLRNPSALSDEILDKLERLLTGYEQALEDHLYKMYNTTQDIKDLTQVQMVLASARYGESDEELQHSIAEFADFQRGKGYTYRGLACNIASDEELWTICGNDKFGGAGVLEWCYNEQDAKRLLTEMRKYSRFENLQAISYLEFQRWSRLGSYDDAHR